MRDGSSSSGGNRLLMKDMSEHGSKKGPKKGERARDRSSRETEPFIKNLPRNCETAAENLQDDSAKQNSV